MRNHLPPEDRYNAKKQISRKLHVPYTMMNYRVWARVSNWWYAKVSTDSFLHEFLLKHSQRSNIQPYLFLFLFSFVCGNVLHYCNYRKNVVEGKWVEQYGQDIPHFRKFKLASWVQRVRAEYVHFYRYRLFYFIEEQVIDPLNDNSLSGKAFEVYQFKRLIRALKYDEIRDDSFDFLQIGDDDLEDFDDFV